MALRRPRPQFRHARACRWIPDHPRGMEMETVITRVSLNDGTESHWDSIMRDRMSAAEASNGWIGGCTLEPADEPSARIVLGLWETRAAWDHWHRNPAFKE